MKPVKPVKSCGPVGLRHGRIIEGCGNEITQTIALAGLFHNRLTDMNDLRRAGAETVHTQQLQGIDVKQDFQHAPFP